MVEANTRKQCILQIKLRHFFELGIVLFGLYGIFGGSRLQKLPREKQGPQDSQEVVIEGDQHNSRPVEVMPSNVGYKSSGLLPGKAALSDHTILLATHSRLLIYNYMLDSTSILHEGLVSMPSAIFVGENFSMAACAFCAWSTQ